jgi:4-cresol dehydrogenase (hydroxylating)
MNAIDTKLIEALDLWRSLLGADRVLTDASGRAANCIGVQRDIPAVLLPASREEVIEALAIARRQHIPLYPVSSGHNWGYGTASPVRDGCVIMDLSRMNRILDFDAETGLLTVEPGVTQRQLAEFLDTNGHPYLLPVSGAGPDCSLVGNAIERGHGITPYADHFEGTMSLEAVMPNGEIYQPALSRLGADRVERAFKWGIGPYIDGLFTQANFGIVTQMTFALAPLPERVEAFFFSVESPAGLEEAVLRIRLALREVGNVSGSINLMNMHRVLAMMEPYPRDHLDASGLISEEWLRTAAQKNMVMAWTGMGALYGNKKVVAAARSVIKKILRPVSARLVFLTPELVEKANKLIPKLPWIRASRLANTLAALDKTMKILAGRPSELALPLAYWRSGVLPPPGTPLDPARDGCGLIWYSPLVPTKPDVVRQYVEMVNAICFKYRLEPLNTFTSLSDRCFLSTVPLLFDRADPAEVKNANECYVELFETGLKYGLAPYRLGIHHMDILEKYGCVPDFIKQIKNAIDPENILAPGRYIST